MKTQTNQTKTKLSLQGPQWSHHYVARVRRRDEYSTFSGMYGIYLANMVGTRKSSLLSVENEMESPPSILVTRNPNWSYRSGTGTGCVKERY